MKFTLGEKQGMTQFFAEDGRVHPATMIASGPVTVVGLMTEDKQGYNAVQVGFGSQKENRIKKAQRGQFGQYGNFRYVTEFRIADPSQFELGQVIDLAGLFEAGEKVQVSGVSKGKGFQGVVKRHGFAGGRRTHGQKHSEREPGSIGSTGPQRVFKGTKMAGRMGSDRVTVKGLKVLMVEGNTLLVKGAVPGRRGTLLEIVAK